MADYGKEEIIKILMRRDKISHFIAEDIVDEVQYVVNDILDSEMTDFERVEAIEEAIKDYLGLDPDYIFAFL